jgi:ATP-binding cassette subfamily B protein IrtA
VIQNKNIINRIMGYAGRYKIAIIFSWIFSAMGGVLSIGMYLCIYRVASGILFDNQIVKMSGYGWKALQLTGMAFGTYGLGLMFSHLAAFNIMAKIRVRLVRHLEKVPLGYYSTNTSGELRKVIEKSVESTENFVAHQMPDAVQSFVMPIAFVISMFYFDWRLSLVCLIPVVIGFLALSAMLKNENADFIDNYQQALSKMGTAGVEYVRGISVVKVFGQTIHSFKQFHKAITNYKKFSLDYVMSMEKPMSIYVTAVNGMFFVLIPMGIFLYNLTQDGGKALHSLIFFVVFTPLVSVLLTRIMNCSSNMMMASQALNSIEDILNVRVQDRGHGTDEQSEYDIEFKDVSFAYTESGNEVLKNLSFLADGEKVTALVGPSGSGKSTIVNLISRFWDIKRGDILVGGVNIMDMDYETWMKQFSFVFQESSLLKMSIADNVAFCCQEATEKQILEALHEARCDDIISNLPQGIHTIVGTKGVYLSGGEQQRIALARAILQDAPIILLDEATSFADPENEYLILKALEKLMKGKTVIMIAHRLSTVLGADKIIVLKDGKIVEQGDHTHLIQKKGIYAEMFKEYNSSTAWRIGDM